MITEEVLVKAAASRSQGPEAFRMLLIEEGVATKVNERVLESAAGRSRKVIQRLYALARAGLPLII